MGGKSYLYDFCRVCGDYTRCKDGRCIPCHKDLQEEEGVSFAVEASYCKELKGMYCSCCGERLSPFNPFCPDCQPQFYELHSTTGRKL